MKILAVETSCDETAIALIEASGGLKNPKFKILENLVASQIKVHRPFGGVVPNLAKREHLRNLPILFKRLHVMRYMLHNLDLIAVTVGPGLEPALWTGINFARDMYRELTINNRRLRTELLGVSHLDGHLYSFLLTPKIYKLKTNQIFPLIALLVSGGHTTLLLMKDLKTVKKLGETVDDAVGESFDKIARLLNLSYPGGPEIEKLAKKGNPDAINFPRPMLNQKNYNFSFSGLKTSVLYYMRDNFPRQSVLSLSNSAETADAAASFQKAAFDVLIKKTLRAAEEFSAKSIMISGGVAANKTLAKEFKKSIRKSSVAGCRLLVTKHPTDNAAMIAAAAYVNYLRKKKYKLVANGNLNI
ncbi:MAG: tRNA (adenosine(37)-N6)-threonylcarbamoyltransferase complex transferase subunit TsaD [Patescibacteria group bacterium]|nr:tRNA (adenosine(37)-N6)-threonylcarbamoyltransferase complex transferase subunit TsaD [Patescibacteria group bacterium]